jgi:hypothetical protein
VTARGYTARPAFDGSVDALCYVTFPSDTRARAPPTTALGRFSVELSLFSVFEAYFEVMKSNMYCSRVF